MMQKKNFKSQFLIKENLFSFHLKLIFTVNILKILMALEIEELKIKKKRRLI